jgi:hypothetical protein
MEEERKRLGNRRLQSRALPMSLTLTTLAPEALLAALYQAIDDKRITTWTYTDRKDFTHTAKECKGMACFRATLRSSELKLNLLRPKGKTVSQEVYASYHGRFIEMVLAHFPAEVLTAHATASPTASDLV